MPDQPNGTSQPTAEGRAAVVITASDGVVRGTRSDTSGDDLTAVLEAAGFEVVARPTVADERDLLVAVMREAINDPEVRLVVVTGGTGLGARDVTPEAVATVADRTLPGFGEVMRASGRAITPLADLSRSLAAASGDTLLIAVPGSPKGAVQSIQAVLGLVPHALDLLAGDTAHDRSDDTIQTAVPGRSGDPVGHDPSCAVAHGDGEIPRVGTLMAVFASPLSALLLAWGSELGYRTVLVDPRAKARDLGDVEVFANPVQGGADETTDIVVTDHHRDELVDILDSALDTQARFIGLMGSKRVTPPHLEPLQQRGRTDEEISRVVRPIGLDIGSQTPGEIAISTLADLVARRTAGPTRPVGTT